MHPSQVKLSAASTNILAATRGVYYVSTCNVLLHGSYTVKRQLRPSSVLSVVVYIVSSPLGSYFLFNENSISQVCLKEVLRLANCDESTESNWVHTVHLWPLLLHILLCIAIIGPTGQDSQECPGSYRLLCWRNNGRSYFFHPHGNHSSSDAGHAVDWTLVILCGVH